MSALDQPWLREYLDRCIEIYREEFDRSAETLPPPFRLAASTVSVPVFEKPAGAQSVMWLAVEAHDDRWPDDWLLRTQAGHELLHWLCTPAEVSAIYHWTHELVANEMSLLCLRRSGIDGIEAYATALEENWRRQAVSDSTEKLLTTPLHREDGGIYGWVFGRAFVVGEELKKAVDWENVKRLATTFGESHQPDLRSWLKGLQRPDRRRAERVLGKPNERWV